MWQALVGPVVNLVGEHFKRRAEEKQAVHPTIFLTEKLYSELTNWVEKYYRTELSKEDLSFLFHSPIFVLF